MKKSHVVVSPSGTGRPGDYPYSGQFATVAAGADTAHTDFTGLTSGDDHTQYLLESTVTAKGDLLAASASATIAALAVGANGTKLTADSAQSTGMKWA